MRWSWRRLCCLWLMLLPWAVLAQGLVVRGSAPVVADDLATARQLAYRDALAQAARQVQVRVAGVTSQVGDVWTDNAVLHTSATFSRADVLREERHGDELTVVVEVTLGDEQAQGECANTFLRKVVVTPFYFEHPQQLGAREFSTYASQVAVEFRRWLNRGQRVLAEHAGPTEGIYVSAERAPVLRPLSDNTQFAVQPLAQKLRAQYVLSGVVRDFGILREPVAGMFGRRALVVDAYLHDGLSGTLLASQRFSHQIEGDIRLATGSVFGSQAFYRSAVGEAFAGLFHAMARWSERHLVCAPFSARVIKVEGQRIFLDVGAESRVARGDTLVIHRVLRQGRVVSLDNELLGYERSQLPALRVGDVYPQFAIGELHLRSAAARVAPVANGNRKTRAARGSDVAASSGPTIEVGDQVYAY